KSMADLRRPGLALPMLVVAASGMARALKTDRPKWSERRQAAADSAKSVGNPDEARAREPGRGRTATSPRQIPWRGWKDIFWRIYHGIQEDRLLAVSAGVVFFGLLAFFPAVTAFVSLYGLFADPA